MPIVSPFFDITSPAQIPFGIDPRSLVNLDLSRPGDPADILSQGSGIHIGAGVILTAAHVPYDISKTLNGAVFSNVVFDVNFGSGLSAIEDVSLHVASDDPSQRFVDGRDRFQSFATPTTGADVALIDLSQGGQIDAGDASYLASVRATPMVLFSNPDEAIGMDIMMFGYPAESRDGTTLCRANGEITGHGPVSLSNSGETVLAYSAAVSNEGGFSGGPVYVSQSIAGVTSSGPLLLGLASASFGPQDGLFSSMSAIYAALAESLAPFHSASEFARNVLIADRSASGTVQGQFFHEDIYGGTFADTIFAAEGNDSVLADQGRDRIFGGQGNDTVFGGAGVDRIFDGIGADAVFGGGGNDVISASDLTDADFYQGGAGDDTLSYSKLSGTLTIDLANGLVTGGSGQSDQLKSIENVQGSLGNDAIIGNGQANVLDGRQGNDTLTGRGGSDSFVFSTGPTAATNVDHITDFQHLIDRIILSPTIYSTLGAAVEDAELHLGTQAADDNDRLIYDGATGTLYYDSDGTGALAQVQFAVLTAGTVLTAADFALG